MSMMLFIFLCFVGLFIMFFCILRGQEKMYAAQREEHAHVRLQLRAMEAHLRALGGEASDQPEARSMPISDPLASLSMGNATAPGDRHVNELELHFDPQENIRR